MNKNGSKINTKEKLFRSAVNLFYSKGYADTSIREIGVKARISDSLIYHYFKNKEEILFEIVNAASQRLIETLIQIEKETSDPLECLRKMLIAHTAHISLQFEKESKILVAENYWIRGKYKTIVIRHQREIYDLYKRKLAEMKQRGLLNEIDLTAVNFSIFGIINWFFRWYKKGGRLSKEEVAENIWKFVFYGMVKKKPL